MTNGFSRLPPGIGLAHVAVHECRHAFIERCTTRGAGDVISGAHRGGAARREGASRLQRVGRARNDGGLRAAIHPARLSQVVGAAGGEHGVRRGFVPGAGGGGGDAAGGVRLRERAVGHPGHRAGYFHGGLADQPLRRRARRRHGSAHARRGLRLHRFDRDLAHLRQLHLHLLRAGGGHHGLCAGAGVRHSAGLGLPGVRAGRGAVGDTRHHGHQPSAGVDAAVVDRAAGGALRLCLPREPRPAARPDRLRGRERAGRRVQRGDVRRRDDRRPCAHHTDGRAGRLPALPAGAHCPEPDRVVGRAA